MRNGDNTDRWVLSRMRGCSFDKRGDCQSCIILQSGHTFKQSIAKVIARQTISGRAASEVSTLFLLNLRSKLLFCLQSTLPLGIFCLFFEEKNAIEWVQLPGETAGFWSPQNPRRCNTLLHPKSRDRDRLNGSQVLVCNTLYSGTYYLSVHTTWMYTQNTVAS
jgi:hypothetical protein